MEETKRAKLDDEEKSSSPVDFFATSTPPKDLGDVERALDNFVAKLPSDVETVVLLTSGGTTVPLEKNTVRFIDNFSTGARGAAMCENFLKSKCAVVFLQRTGSVTPFTGSLGNKQHVDFRLLLDIAHAGGLPKGALEDAKRADDYIKSGKLLTISFTSVFDYLYKLRSCAMKLDSPKLLVVLAAAVSDFFIPETEMEEHKIQSAGGGLEMSLRPVPKLLGDLKRLWCPRAFCVSFKLETDLTILIKKATGAIEKYAMDLVVANELHSRYNQVILVEPPIEAVKLVTVLKPKDDIIELPLVAALLDHKTRRHVSTMLS